MVLGLLIEGCWGIELSIFGKLYAISTSGRDFHFGDILTRVVSILKDGKHITTTNTLAEVQIRVTTTIIAIGLRGKITKFLYRHNFDFSHQLSHGSGSAK